MEGMGAYWGVAAGALSDARAVAEPMCGSIRDALDFGREVPACMSARRTAIGSAAGCGLRVAAAAFEKQATLETQRGGKGIKIAMCRQRQQAQRSVGCSTQATLHAPPLRPFATRCETPRAPVCQCGSRCRCCVCASTSVGNFRLVNFLVVCRCHYVFFAVTVRCYTFYLEVLSTFPAFFSSFNLFFLFNRILTTEFWM
jgi:hypothetical protein